MNLILFSLLFVILSVDASSLVARMANHLRYTPFDRFEKCHSYKTLIEGNRIVKIVICHGVEGLNAEPFIRREIIFEDTAQK